MSEVVALWQDLTCSGPHNVVWVLAPRRPLSAWVAMSGGRQAAAGSSFAVSFEVSGTACQTGVVVLVGNSELDCLPLSSVALPSGSCSCCSANRTIGIHNITDE
jgi:hypothetical protein